MTQTYRPKHNSAKPVEEFGVSVSAFEFPVQGLAIPV